MPRTYLLEVGMEEIPARFLLSLRDQLQDRISDFLTDERVQFDSIESFATPRRLAVRVNGLADVQEGLSEKIKGPALRIARGEDGEWSKAAQGFLRGQGATEDDIIIEEFKGEDYLYINKVTEGEPIQQVLPRIVSVLSEMNFPVSMNWHDYKKPYIRPVHWLVSLLDNEVIPFTFYNIEADNVTLGHRFLGKEIKVETPNDYETSLKEIFVIADFEERQDLIRQQIETIASENKWDVPIDGDLLEEVTAIVEWPYAFAADFSEEYLEVPDVVLITAMRDHQRYFYALDPQTGQLLPNFISVRNGDDNHIDNVIKGNQKVLRARLEDALFFYREDMNKDLEYFMTRLESLKEHYELDSIANKQFRVANLVENLSKAFNEVEAGKIAYNAAQIYKFDLTTQIVEEFSELQGTIGEIYGKKFGIKEEVARAIGEQYLPDHAGGDMPETKAGAILALSDKLDTLLNYFNINLIPTGSNDPYGLRRQAMGLVEIIIDNQWTLNLNNFLQLVINDMQVKNENLLDDVLNFVKARASQYLERNNIDHDIIQSVLDNREFNIDRAVKLAHALQELKNERPSVYQEMIEALTRVVNLGDNSEIKESRLDISIAETESEKQLINLVSHNLVYNPNRPVEIFIELTEPINDYFENNMVNSDKRKLKKNRLATMKHITDFVLKIMEPRKLISKF